MMLSHMVVKGKVGSIPVQFYCLSLHIKSIEIAYGISEVWAGSMYLPYLVPSSRVRLLVIAMIIFLQVSRSLAEPHSSASVQFVTALMSSSQRARGLPLFLEPPPIPSIIDFSKLFSLRMICPKYDNCCFFIIICTGCPQNGQSRFGTSCTTALPFSSQDHLA